MCHVESNGSCGAQMTGAWTPEGVWGTGAKMCSIGKVETSFSQGLLEWSLLVVSRLTSRPESVSCVSAHAILYLSCGCNTTRMGPFYNPTTRIVPPSRKLVRSH